MMAHSGTSGSTGGDAPLRTDLRDRRRAQTNDLIADAFSELTLTNPRFTMQELADAAGISVRTLYRHFANREELVAGMLRVVNQRMPPEHISGEGLIEPGSEGRVRRSFEIFGEHDKLMRAVVVARLSGSLVDPSHGERNARIVEGVEQRHGDKPDVLKRQLAALTRLIGGSAGWMTLTDGAIDLTHEEAGDAAAWALRTLIAAADAENGRLE